MKCDHPGNHVTADILQGDAKGFEVKWCRICGAFKVRSFDPDYLQGGKRDYTSPWNLPRVEATIRNLRKAAM